jgi:cytochrome c oxidase subunit II
MLSSIYSRSILTCNLLRLVHLRYMNKTILILMASLLFVVTCVIIFVYRSTQLAGQSNIIHIIIHRDTWTFSPTKIKLKMNTQYKFIVTNNDFYQHGIFIPEYNINLSLEPESNTEFEIFTNKSGTFYFSCSVICGSGHTMMTGEIIVEE